MYSAPPPFGSVPPPRRNGRGRQALAVVVLATAVGVPLGAYGLMNLGASAPQPLYGYAHMAMPLAGATVEIRPLGPDGEPGKVLVTALTDEDGYYEVSLRRGSGSVLLVTASGGSYVDSATHKSRSAGQGFLQTAVLADQERGPVTPLTTMATARATWLTGKGKELDVAVEAAFAATARQFNLESVTATDPAVASDPNEVQVADRSSRQMGLILAGLDAEARSLGATPLGLTDAVAEDLGDGVLDGVNGSEAVLVDGSVMLPADATTARLQKAIDSVAASSTANKTRLPAPQIAKSEPQLDLAADTFYVTTSALPVWQDGQVASARIQGKGGKTPYACELAAGSLPKGFSLSSGCVISGSMALGKTSMRISPPFTVRMEDASDPPRSATVELRITVTGKPPVIAVTDGRCPAAKKPCSVTLATAKGGSPPYYFTTGSFASGTPPMGMTLGLKGVLSGTPSRAGTYSFQICVVDAVGATDCESVSVVVGEAEATARHDPNLPSGFPADLPSGTYHISACTSVAGAGSVCVDGGTFQVSDGDAGDLAEGLSQAADQIRSACACSVRYTAWNGREFDLVITDPSSGSVTTLKVVKVG